MEEGRKREREGEREGRRERRRGKERETLKPLLLLEKGTLVVRRPFIILLKEFHQQRTKNSDIGTYGAILIQTTTMYAPNHINANSSVYIMLFICMFSVLAIRIG